MGLLVTLLLTNCKEECQWNEYNSAMVQYRENSTEIATLAGNFVNEDSITQVQIRAKVEGIMLEQALLREAIDGYKADGCPYSDKYYRE